MGMRYLLTSLATFGGTVTPVSGTIHSYDLDTIPEKLTRATIPALIMVPEVGSEQGYRPLSFMGNSPEVVMSVSHLLLYDFAENRDTRRVLPNLLSQVDNYVTAAKTQKFLDTQASPANQVAVNFTIDIGITNYAGIDFHSATFKHTYTIYYA